MALLRLFLAFTFVCLVAITRAEQDGPFCMRCSLATDCPPLSDCLDGLCEPNEEPDYCTRKPDCAPCTDSSECRHDNCVRGLCILPGSSTVHCSQAARRGAHVRNDNRNRKKATAYRNDAMYEDEDEDEDIEMPRRGNSGKKQSGNYGSLRYTQRKGKGRRQDAKRHREEQRRERLERRRKSREKAQKAWHYNSAEVDQEDENNRWKSKTQL